MKPQSPSTDVTLQQRNFVTCRRRVERVSAITSGDEIKDQRQEVQVQKLREAAQTRFKSILVSIESGTSEGASDDGKDGSNTALQQRLEKAITSLQEGLVERDTEASLPRSS